MKDYEIVWNENGWTVLQEADAETHTLEIVCRAENGVVTQVRVRHNDGEEAKATALKYGKPCLPLALDDFKKNYLAKTLEIKEL